MKIWIAWASSREQTLAEWATHIDNLIANKAASCKSIIAYNKAAIAHYHAEMNMAFRVNKAGIETGDKAAADLQPPFFPVLYGEKVDVRDIPGGGGRVALGPVIPGCVLRNPKTGELREAEFPDFSKLRIFGPPDAIEGAKTPQRELGLVWFGWAAIVLGSLLVGGMSAYIIFGDMTEKEYLEGDRAMRAQDVEVNESIDGANDSCVQSFFNLAEASGKPLTVEEHLRIRKECLDGALRTHKRLTHIERADPLGKSILLAGLGLAAAAGTVAFFRSKQNDS